MSKAIQPAHAEARSGTVHGELLWHAALRTAKLRPTRQRLALAELLFRDGHRHVTADDLQRDAEAANITMSLATVYNTLNQFADAGLIRRVSVEGGRAYFDTDVGDHQHFYVEDENRIIDVPCGSVRVGEMPAPPRGYRIAHVDVVIRLTRAVPDEDSQP